ncbi:hypothetical protein AAC387_Pa09g0468 [Persea americana]
MSIGNGKALRLHSDTRAALPLLAWAVDSNSPVLLHSERRKTGSCSFTAAYVGGKAPFQFSFPRRGGKLATAALPLFPSAVKSIFQFSSALRGGKLEIADTLRAHLAVIFQSDFLSFFFLLLPVGGSWVGALFHKMKGGHVSVTIG